MKLLIIRPEPGASASAERAREAGLEPVLLPFFEVQAMGWDLPDPADYDALLLTSGLGQRQFKLTGIKRGQQLACAHHLAFFKQHFGQHTRHLRPHPDSG